MVAKGVSPSTLEQYPARFVSREFARNAKTKCPPREHVFARPRLGCQTPVLVLGKTSMRSRMSSRSGRTGHTADDSLIEDAAEPDRGCNRALRQDRDRFRVAHDR